MPYYLKLPDGLTGRSVLVLDPMLATGGSASHAIGLCREAGARDVTLAALIAAPEGIARVREEQPDAHLCVAALDERLNDVGFIVPGLGRRGRPHVRDAVRRRGALDALLLAAAALAPAAAAARHRARDDAAPS